MLPNTNQPYKYSQMRIFLPNLVTLVLLSTYLSKGSMILELHHFVSDLITF